MNINKLFQNITEETMKEETMKEGTMEEGTMEEEIIMVVLVILKNLKLNKSK
jgi:hypothetical protein